MRALVIVHPEPQDPEEVARQTTTAWASNAGSAWASAAEAEIQEMFLSMAPLFALIGNYLEEYRDLYDYIAYLAVYSEDWDSPLIHPSIGRYADQMEYISPQLLESQLLDLKYGLMQRGVQQVDIAGISRYECVKETDIFLRGDMGLSTRMEESAIFHFDMDPELYDEIVAHKIKTRVLERLTDEPVEPAADPSPWSARYRRNAVSRPSVQISELYTRFVALAAVGFQVEADHLFRNHRNQILRVAEYLKTKYPPQIKTLYRGLLLDPQRVAAWQYQIPGNWLSHTYISFSEDFDAACWFARPDSYISERVASQYPNKTGWIGKHDPSLGEIVFHYEWVKDGIIGDLPGRNVYEFISNEEVMNLKCHLDTQKEVLLLPGISLNVVEVDTAGCPPSSYLDNKFIARPDFILGSSAPLSIIQKFGISPTEKLRVTELERLPPTDCPVCKNQAFTLGGALRTTILIFFDATVGKIFGFLANLLAARY